MTSVMPFRFAEKLTMAELAARLHKPSGEAARKWARRHQVPMEKCGREWRVDMRDVEAVMKKQTRQALARHAS